MEKKSIVYLAIASIALSGLFIPTDAFATTNGKLGNQCSNIQDLIEKLSCRRDMSDKRDEINNNRYENQKGLRATTEILELQKLQIQRSTDVKTFLDLRNDTLVKIKTLKIDIAFEIFAGNHTGAQLLREELHPFVKEDKKYASNIRDLVDVLEDGCLELHALWANLDHTKRNRA